MDLMGGLFSGGGIGWMVASRESWSMAQYADGHQRQVVSLVGPYWDQYCLLTVGSSAPSATNTKLSGAVDMPEGQDAIQRDLDKLEKWAHVDFIMLSKAKCNALHLGQCNPC
ncbi:pol- hypothetical protein [Limosa lapponica baueri]|uniref:Rna-directed dna polymerase from mobile element jockey-like n=1 Tax=Limosa lapponica baueri TaxID=1758121 RepID=A0A2I0U191_LIMLA|nr:pol- hypothetical protein [Limosa lapponica baueri]